MILIFALSEQMFSDRVLRPAFRAFQEFQETAKSLEILETLETIAVFRSDEGVETERLTVQK